MLEKLLKIMLSIELIYTPLLPKCLPIEAEIKKDRSGLHIGIKYILTQEKYV
jgi:hypothetical protein